MAKIMKSRHLCNRKQAVLILRVTEELGKTGPLEAGRTHSWLNSCEKVTYLLCALVSSSGKCKWGDDSSEPTGRCEG